MDKYEAIDTLMRIHYNTFMSDPRFWYDKNLQEADKMICVAASNLRIQPDEAVNDGLISRV